LTNFLRDYKIDMQIMVQDQIAPIVPRTTSTGEYHAMGKELFDIHVSDVKGIHDHPNTLHYDVSKGSFEAKEYALMIPVSDKERRESLSPWDPMRRASITLRHALRLRKERRLVELAAATSNNSTPAQDWDDALATIVADVNAGKAAMKTALGWKPNTCVWGDHISDEIVGQADIIDLIKYAAAMAKPTAILDNLSSDDLPGRMFGMRRLQPTAMYNTAQPGAAGSYANAWADDAYLFYVAPGNVGPSWAVTIQSLGMSVRTVRDDKMGGWFVVAGWEYQVKEVTAEAVHKLIDVT
jgi:hypothetical protein